MKTVLSLFSVIALLSCSKNETVTSATTPATETVYVEKTVDQQIAHEDTPTTPEKTMEDRPVSGLKDLSGTHDLTLQWISWDKPGKISFKKIAKNKYQVSGLQSKGKDYLKVEGEITQVSAIKLGFEGTIEHSVANNGEKCIRKGSQILIATQNRKYWRLQNMVECGGLTDYIDIYF